MDNSMQMLLEATARDLEATKAELQYTKKLLALVIGEWSGDTTAKRLLELANADKECRVKIFYPEPVDEPKNGRWAPSYIEGMLMCSECHGCHVPPEWLDGKHGKCCPHCNAMMEI